jgi:ferritin-like metal-binding protein YciE
MSGAVISQAAPRIYAQSSDLAHDLRFSSPTPIPFVMPNPNSLQELLMQEIKDLYSAEIQLVKALPKMAKAATDPDLKAGFETHLVETEGHVERLEEVAKLLDGTPRGKSCKAMKGLVEEGEEIIGEDGHPAFKDLALITAAQKVEHYEIAGYGSARALAQVMGRSDVADLLQATLDEEGQTDKNLTAFAEKIVQQIPVR